MKRSHCHNSIKQGKMNFLSSGLGIILGNHLKKGEVSND